MGEYGYAGKILQVDLSNGNILKLSTANYADRFLGGRGIAAKLYWDLVSPETKALSPDNCLAYITGPLTGFGGIASPRWQVCGKSPASEPEAFTFSNMGGRWGLTLKRAGYDGVVVRAKADRPVYLFIQDDTVEVRDASHLWGKSSFDTIDYLKEALGKAVSVLTIGPAAENLVIFATMFAEGNASGSSGLGAVMGSKMLKAIVVAGNRAPKAADAERLRKLVSLIRELKGRPPGGGEGFSPWAVPGITRPTSCYGCGLGCTQQAYTGEKGRRYRSFCQATDVYKKPVLEYYGEWNEAQLLAIRLCDGYGLDTAVMQPLIQWLIRCYQEGVLTEAATRLPLSKAGSAEFIEVLTRQIAFRDGFGDLLAQGTVQAANQIGSRAEELTHDLIATRSNETKEYDPRLFITTGIFYATEPRRPIQQLHGISTATMMWMPSAQGLEDAPFSADGYRAVAAKFWGSEIAADFSTYEGKALAAKKVQDRAYAKDSLVLCDFSWPMTWTNHAGGRVGDSTLENQIFSAVTGQETDEAGLNEMGERIFNLQRAIQLRGGWGGRQNDWILDYFFTEPLKQGVIFFNADALMPGPGGAVISRLGAVVDREKFDNMLSEYYTLRGWNATNGLPTAKKLKELELEDISSDLEKRGLLG